MMRRFMESWLLLLYFDWLMHCRGLKFVLAAVREQQLNPAAKMELTDPTLSHTVDLACVFYFKRVLCLQRSAAATVLLRRNGWNAEMVIGAQLLPFKSHAWVEIDGRVANDKPYITEMFLVLERC